MINETQTWVVVADGAKALVMAYHGPDQPLQPIPDGDFKQPNLPSREIVTDDRGRGFAGKGISEARGAMEYTSDPHEFEETRFLGRVSDFLDNHVSEFDRLIVAAAPKALGTLRKKVSDNVQKKIYAELDKDLAGLSLEDMRSHLQGVLNINTRH